MGTYHFRYLAEPAPILDEEFVLAMAGESGGRKTIRVSPLPGSPRRGLAIDIQFSRNAWPDALQESFKTANVTVSMLTFAAPVKLPAPLLKLAFDWSEDRTDHEFLQLVDLPTIRPREVLLRKERLQQLAAINDLPEEEALSIFRALRWYYYAGQQTTRLFQFLAFWFALEALEPGLHKRVKPRPPSGRTGSSKPKTPGIQDLMLRMPYLPADFYDTVRQLRNRAAHGWRKLGETEDQAKTLIEPLARTTRAAIAEVMGTDINTGAGLPVSLEEPLRVSIRTVVHCDRPGYFGSEGELPRFEEAPIIDYFKVALPQGGGAEGGPPLIPRMAEGVRAGPVTVALHSREIEWVDFSAEFVEPAS